MNVVGCGCEFGIPLIEAIAVITDGDIFETNATGAIWPIRPIAANPISRNHMFIQLVRIPAPPIMLDSGSPAWIEVKWMDKMNVSEFIFSRQCYRRNLRVDLNEYITGEYITVQRAGYQAG